MTRNVTLRIDERILKKCRHAAVEMNLSLSQWMTNELLKTVARKENLEKNKAKAIRHLQKGYHLKGRPLEREKTHAR